MSAKPKSDDQQQSKRFVELAQELGADSSKEAFERAFRKVAAAPRKPLPAKKKRR